MYTFKSVLENSEKIQQRSNFNFEMKTHLS